MVTIEFALRLINKHGGNLDTTTGKLNIPSRILEKKEIKRAVHILKEAGPDKVKAVLASVQAPYIDGHGVLVIPFESNPRYHWWSRGQSVLETLRELKASPEIIAKYGPGYSDIGEDILRNAPGNGHQCHRFTRAREAKRGKKAIGSCYGFKNKIRKPVS